MSRPRHVGLALDVHDPRPSHRKTRRDPGGQAEDVVSDAMNRETVHLADLGSGNVDQDAPLVDRLLELLLGQRDALAPGPEGLADVIDGDDGPPLLRGPPGGFADHVRDVDELRRQPVRPARLPRAVLDDGRHPSAVKRGERFGGRDVPDEAGVLENAVRLSLHGRVELGLDLEDLRKVGIGGVKELVQLAVSNHQDLHAARDRLGLQNGGREHEDRIVRLDLERAVAQRPLERRPHAGLAQDIARVEDEEPSVRARKRARLDPHEVGPPLPAPVEGPVDRAEQVLVGRRGLVHDGRALRRGVVHDEVHAVLEKRIGGRRDRWPGRRGLLLGPEAIEVRDDRLLELIEILADSLLLVALSQLDEGIVNEREDQVAVEFREAFFGLAHRLPHELQHPLELLGEDIVALLDPLELGRLELPFRHEAFELVEG